MGVVFSDATLHNLRRADPESAETIAAEFSHWDDIDVHFKGTCHRSGGHGFIGIGRKKLLNILQDRCLELGVELVFETQVTDDQDIARQYQADLVIASDGINSAVRTRYEEVFKPDIDPRRCRFVWLGTKRFSMHLPSYSPKMNTVGSKFMPINFKRGYQPLSLKRQKKLG